MFWPSATNGPQMGSTFAVQHCLPKNRQTHDQKSMKMEQNLQGFLGAGRRGCYLYPAMPFDRLRF